MKYIIIINYAPSIMSLTDIYQKNIRFLFILALLVVSVSVLAASLVLLPLNEIVVKGGISATLVLWIILLAGSVIYTQNKFTFILNICISVIGFISSFVLATGMFFVGAIEPVTLFLFWVSLILFVIFILSSYFSIQVYRDNILVSKKKNTRKKTATRKKTTTRRVVKKSV